MLTSPVISANFTGGAPGTPAYEWSFVSQNSGTFLNPLTASSQRIQRTTSVPQGQQAVTYRCRITDSLGNLSDSETGTSTFEVSL